MMSTPKLPHSTSADRSTKGSKRCGRSLAPHLAGRQAAYHGHA